MSRKFCLLTISMLGMLGMLWVSGCGITPQSPLRTENLKGDKLIYFEQSDRVPRGVVMMSWMEYTNNVYAKGLDVVGAMGAIDKIFGKYPDIVKAYGEERMNNVMVQRRILIKGYSGTNELEAIKGIIEAMGGCIENWTFTSEYIETKLKEP